MRSITLAAATIVSLLVFAAGAALAATYVGTDRPDSISGSASDDLIRGLGGGDRLYGGFGSDRIYGGTGRDLIYAGGDQRIDFVDCGPGHDTVTLGFSGTDRDVYRNCERRPTGPFMAVR